MGATGRWVLVRHMVPNTLGVSVVTATFAIADSIYALSALSFLGIGPPPPFTDWGTMLTDGVNNLFNGYWWQVYPPLIVLVLVVVAFRQVGDALNDIVSGQRSDAAAAAPAVPAAAAVRPPARVASGRPTAARARSSHRRPLLCTATADLAPCCRTSHRRPPPGKAMSKLELRFH